AYSFVQSFFGSLIGRALLFAFTWALIHHMLGGIRHLIWDTGTGLDIPTVERFALGTIVGSVTLTVLVWLIAYYVMGGL
ncbi:MAG: succinate dehydrogenase, cytochrome b556 subunit, partial [Methyloceanibacter sp.]